MGCLQLTPSYEIVEMHVYSYIATAGPGRPDAQSHFHEIAA